MSKYMQTDLTLHKNNKIDIDIHIHVELREKFRTTRVETKRFYLLTFLLAYVFTTLTLQLNVSFIILRSVNVRLSQFSFQHMLVDCETRDRANVLGFLSEYCYINEKLFTKEKLTKKYQGK